MFFDKKLPFDGTVWNIRCFAAEYRLPKAENQWNGEFMEMKQPIKETQAAANWPQRLLLAAAFGAVALLALCVSVHPILQAAALAADGTGYQAAPSPKELFCAELSENAPETVDIADAGGYPQQGELYGKVSIPGTSVECNLYYGDDNTQLHAGAGTFAGAQIPGEGGVTLIAGHTGSYFRGLESVKEGDDIVIQTKYGEYHYKVTEMFVMQADEFTQQNLDESPRESVLLYTCYPFGQLTVTPLRYMVRGEYVSGPKLVVSTGGGE